MKTARVKTFLSVFDKEEKTPTPIWLMRQAGRYLPEYKKVRAGAGGFLDLCYTPELAIEVTLQPIHRFGFDAAILFADILLVPDALGQTVSFVENEGPRLEPIRGLDDLANLSLERLHEHLDPVYRTVSGLARALPAETTLIGFAGAPWTVATYMVEGKGSVNHAAAKTWAYGDPDGFGKLVSLITQATSDYLIAQIKAGAEVVQIFDTWAGALAEPLFRRWCIEPTKQIVERIRKEFPDFPILGFPRGAGLLYRDYFIETGVSGISLDTTVPLAWAARELQPIGPVQGNLDPLALVAGGASLKSETARICKALRGGGHIFNLGHGILPQTPPDHVAELVEFVRHADALQEK